MSTARRPKSWPLCALVLAAAAVGCAKGNEATGAAGSGGSTGAAGSGGGFNPYASYAAKALHAQGNKIVDTTGATVRLLGVNRSGSEYMCVPPTSGSYVFDGATGPSTIAGMKAWHINTVRLPLTESCWLGINGALVTAEHYREEVTNYMLQLHANGIYVVLDLHWSAPGTTAIRGGSGGNQLVTMAFADHALDFWTSVATTFKDDPMVIFDLFNEPILNASDRMGHTAVSDPWGCWLNGCNLTSGTLARVAGMQSMLDAVRATGAQQLVVAGGIEWAHNMDGWLAHKPADPAGNLLAGFHVYQPTLATVPTQLLERLAGAGRGAGAGAGRRDGRAGLRARLHRRVHGVGRRQGHVVPGLGVEPAKLQLVPGAGHRLGTARRPRSARACATT